SEKCPYVDSTRGNVTYTDTAFLMCVVCHFHLPLSGLLLTVRPYLSAKFISFTLQHGLIPGVVLHLNRQIRCFQDITIAVVIAIDSNFTRGTDIEVIAVFTTYITGDTEMDLKHRFIRVTRSYDTRNLDITLNLTNLVPG